MAEINHTHSVLVISSTDKSGKVIAGLLDPSLCPSVRMEKSGASARQRVQETVFDLIVVNAPLSDEFGHDLACDLARQTTAGVILLVKTDIYDEICDRVNDDGVITIAKPLSPPMFAQAARMGLASGRRLQRMEKECQQVKKKLDEMKFVSRAKCLLIEFQNYSESQAHRYIEKQAMDQRMSRRAVAEDIIRSFEG